jgi:hypothetical protein
MTLSQALIAQMSSNDYVWNAQSGLDGHVTHLFFSPRQSLELYTTYPEVLFIDCTYKTICFHMPLCNNIGISIINTLFYVALVVL